MCTNLHTPRIYYMRKYMYASDGYTKNILIKKNYSCQETAMAEINNSAICSFSCSF